MAMQVGPSAQKPSYLALTPAKAGVGRCEAVWQKHIKTHTQTQSTDLHVEETQAMFCKRRGSCL